MQQLESHHSRLSALEIYYSVFPPGARWAKESQSSCICLSLEPALSYAQVASTSCNRSAFESRNVFHMDEAVHTAKGAFQTAAKR